MAWRAKHAWPHRGRPGGPTAGPGGAGRLSAPARLTRRASDIDWEWLGEPSTLGLTAGASAPETLVREVLDVLAQRFQLTEEEADHDPERMVFKLPRELVA